MANLPPPHMSTAQHDPTNVLGRRIAAYAIDAAIATMVFVVVFLALADSQETVFDPCGFDNSPTLCIYSADTVYFAEGGTATAIVLSGIGYWVAIGSILQGLTGGTPGKLMVGIRVVRQDTGQIAGVGRCAARTVMWVADAFPFIFPLVGLITAIASTGHRRVGDMVASTLVVRSDQVGRVPWVPGLTAAPGSAGPPAQPFGSPRTIDAPPPQPAQPIWDAERNAYVLWDAPSQRWLIHDTAADQWRPL